MTFNACTCDSMIVPFVECRIEAGSDDTKVDRRGLVVGAWTLGAPHVFSAKNVVVSHVKNRFSNLTKVQIGQDQ